MYVTSVGKSSVNILILDDMREHMPESNHVNVDYVGNSSVNILPLDDMREPNIGKEIKSAFISILT